MNDEFENDLEKNGGVLIKALSPYLLQDIKKNQENS
jgi:hypothetical protein